MKKPEQEEERNKRIGMLASIGTQVVLLILFYFIIAWRAPFPPIPEYGIELGLASTPAGPEVPNPAPAPVEENSKQEAVEEQTPLETQNTEEAETETPVDAQSTPAPSEPTEPIEETLPVEETKPTESPAPIEEVAPSEPEAPKVEQRALMKASESKTSDAAESDAPKREVDQRAIYGGSSGTSNNTTNEGASLQMAGWLWDAKPKPMDNSDQSGQIVYKIMVDQEGLLVNIETVTSSVSPAVERKYREAVQQLTFSKTNATAAAATSTGYITFTIKSK